jgi:hypothetical protein
MKRTNLIILLLVIVSLSFVAASVEKRVGEQLNLASWANPDPEITFDANTPFHVAHGWGWNFFYGLKEEELFAYMASPGTQKFTLEIDGVDQKFDFFQVGTENKLIFEWEGEEYIYRHREYFWVFNYPEGMEGTHTFHATWWMQCKYVYYDACEKPNEPVPASDRTLIVNFIEP